MTGRSGSSALVRTTTPISSRFVRTNDPIGKNVTVLTNAFTSDALSCSPAIRARMTQARSGGVGSL